MGRQHAEWGLISKLSAVNFKSPCKVQLCVGFNYVPHYLNYTLCGCKPMDGEIPSLFAFSAKAWQLCLVEIISFDLLFLIKPHSKSWCNFGNRYLSASGYLRNVDCQNFVWLSAEQRQDGNHIHNFNMNSFRVAHRSSYDVRHIR